MQRIGKFAQWDIVHANEDAALKTASRQPISAGLTGFAFATDRVSQFHQA
jgi:hypothetical protein